MWYIDAEKFIVCTCSEVKEELRVLNILMLGFSLV